MKISRLMQNVTIAAVTNLHFIIMNTNNKQLQNQCKQTIQMLHEKQLLPAVEFRCSFPKDGD